MALPFDQERVIELYAVNLSKFNITIMVAERNAPKAPDSENIEDGVDIHFVTPFVYGKKF